LAAEIFERFAYLLSLSMTMSSRFYLCYASQDPKRISKIILLYCNNILYESEFDSGILWSVYVAFEI